jgi:hypothetical protein
MGSEPQRVDEPTEADQPIAEVDDDWAPELRAARDEEHARAGDDA